MNILSVEEVSKSYGIRVLFEGVTFGIDQKEKVGLVAKNGTGKTSLLKIIAGLDSPDSGNVTLNNNVTASYLTQDQDFDPNTSILDTVLDAEHPGVNAFRNYQNIIASGSASDNQMQQAVDEVEKHNAWDMEAKAKQMLSIFEIDDFEKNISTLSGGQIKRVALAKILLEEPELLILDEPTNHLDLQMIEWLEGYLKNMSSAILMVTHDRYFLNRICDSILELDNQKLYKYKGNYNYFVEKKAEREEQLMAETSKAKNLLRKELDWMRKQPKARGTKAKSRIDAFYDTKEKASQKVGSDDKLEADVKMSRLGSKILEIKKISKSYDDLKLIENFTYTFKKGDKVGIIGKNGVGKSTLLKIITGQLAPDTGKVVTGETLVFGYYTQDGIKVEQGKRVIEVIKDIAEFIPISKGRTLSAAQMLERFMFPRDSHYQQVSKLSGGEQKRLYLLTVLMRNPNFLILDEPTNDLDIFTINVLEDYLRNFEGCLIVVSHDRFFIDKLVEHTFAFEGNGVIRDFPGGYSLYREKTKEREADEKQQKAEKAKVDTPVKKTNKLTYGEKIEMEKLEKGIAELEKQKNRLEEQLNNPELSSEKMVEISTQIGTLSSEMDEKEMRWLELSEK